MPEAGNTPGKPGAKVLLVATATHPLLRPRHPPGCCSSQGKELSQIHRSCAWDQAGAEGSAPRPQDFSRAPIQTEVLEGGGISPQHPREVAGWRLQGSLSNLPWLPPCGAGLRLAPPHHLEDPGTFWGEGGIRFYKEFSGL